MYATRQHLSFPAEWITATAFLVATFVVGSLIVNELRVQAPPTSRGTVVSEPAQTALPEDAVAVPKLVLGKGGVLAVGESAIDAEARLAGVTVVGRTTEHGPLGLREVRSYELAGTHFIVIFEPFERRGELKVAGIYLR